MTAPQLRRILARMKWSHADAARELRVASRQLVGLWCRGERPVPPYIARSLETRVALEKCLGAASGGATPDPK